MIYISIITSVIVVLGIFTFFLISRKPELFWPLLISLPLVFSGLMIAGRAVADEFFLAAVVAGGFFAGFRGVVSRRDGEKISPHWWVFLFTIFYFFLQSLRGAIVFDDVKILRWAGYFLLFGALLWLLRKWRFSFPSIPSVAKIMGLASSVYFGSYLFLGLLDECAKGIARWSSQGVFWAGSSYAIFPLILSIPAGIILLSSDGKFLRRLGWITIAVSIFAVGYYESRVGWFVIFAAFFLIPFILGLRRALHLAPGLFIISVLSLLWTLGVFATPYCHTFLSGEETPVQAAERLFDADRYKPRLFYFAKGIIETVVDPFNPRASDVDRVLHIKAGLSVAGESPRQFLFGGGTHSHRLLLHTPLSELYHADLPEVEVSSMVRTVGLSAVLVDFGVVGIVLIILNVFFVIKAIIYGSGGFGRRRVTVFVFAIVLIPFWFLVSDIQDMAIYFLLLMPENVFTLIVRDS